MSQLLDSIDARTRLAGTNKLEMLLFTLGTDPRTGRCEMYGINVFKVREVMRTPAITRAPDMPRAVEGMVSLRGALVPVIDLARYTGVPTESTGPVMIVTEYNGHTQGFLVEAVDTIARLDWNQMRVPPAMLKAESGGLVTAVTELKEGRLVMMLDVERVLSEIAGIDSSHLFAQIQPLASRKDMVFYVDDSTIARKQIERTLEALQIKGACAANGSEAWQMLKQMADYAEASGVPLKQSLGAIITDVEMPEMDGYILTKNIKSDARFAGVPVIMHSSLSGHSNQGLGRSVGVDEYVSKFEPRRLAEAITRLLGAGPSAHERRAAA
jgi:two-component system, chemotaxis family, chemotaxis protein CheV